MRNWDDKIANIVGAQQTTIGSNVVVRALIADSDRKIKGVNVLLLQRLIEHLVEPNGIVSQTWTGR